MLLVVARGSLANREAEDMSKSLYSEVGDESVGIAVFRVAMRGKPQGKSSCPNICATDGHMEAQRSSTEPTATFIDK